MGRFHHHSTADQTAVDHRDHGHEHRHDGDDGHGGDDGSVCDHASEGDDEHGVRGVRDDGSRGTDVHRRGEERDVGDHSGYETGTERITVLENILDENDRVAADNRSLLRRHGVRAINLMSAPGAGKTTLLQRTIPVLAETMRVGVLEGDIATSIDADALTGLGAAVALVNTSNGFGGECHLDAVMVRAGLARLPLENLDLVVIENVGNLVCPAEFDVGQDARAMVYSLTEGEEKPLKYPVMFRSTDVVVVNKSDLLPHIDADLDLFRRNVRAVNPDAELLLLSARTGEGVEAWTDWLTRLCADDEPVGTDALRDDRSA